MTVAELEDRMSMEELTHWHVRDEMMERERKKLERK